MNASRRKIIKEAQALVERAAELLEQAACEEREYYDAMPEAIQSGDKGDRASEVADALDEMVETLGAVDFDDVVS